MISLKNKNKRFDLIMGTAVVAGFYGILQLIGITCPIKFMTGVSCAGCGMTRAWIRVLHLDFAGAFHYHPLFFLPPAVLVMLLLKKHMSKRVFQVCMLTVILSFLIIYLVRMIWFQNEIMVFHPSQNALFRIIRWLQHS